MILHMLKRAIYIFLLCVLASCGSHRKAVKSGSNISKGKDLTQKKEEKGKHKQTSILKYTQEPWVMNASRPFNITQGLQNRHLSVWASHGRYYNQKKNKWQWQRPYLFCTTEDLFTQTIVVPYLIPMLENAGANVFTPRERDWQCREIIVDNDNNPRLPYYTEVNMSKSWHNAETKGFAYKDYLLNENPFELGTARMAKASEKNECEISYQPRIPQSGEYAVYVSYQTVRKSVPDAQYTVVHKGKKTVFNVNQRMGGGTWVYLGTFRFDKGCNMDNRVILSNKSRHKGYVTADAVRFGGGMGNIKRGNITSTMARCFEGARYYAQWAGAPDSVYNSKNNTDDYGDDINTRSYMTNWLAGGSCFVPSLNGKNVPIELSLAIHSDAGFTKDYSSIYGSLAICTTNFHNGKLNSGLPRTLSKDFAGSLLSNVQRDIYLKYGKWNRRDLYDKNYSETRCPEVPSAILETLSHQNFPDMRMGQDPNFRFTLARSIYKTILQHLYKQDNGKYTVAPLAPKDPYIEFSDAGEVTIRWATVKDPTEPTALPSSFILYTSAGNSGFDNGIPVKGNACRVKLVPGLIYRFKVTAVNSGGESFPSEIMSAVYEPDATKTIMIVNGFHRLSAPQVIDNDSLQGFDIVTDPGVPYIKTAGWSGRQLCFNKKTIGMETTTGLGYSDNGLEGTFVAGNEFNYTATHAEAIAQIRRYNIVSCSSGAVEKNLIDLMKYHCIDLILGQERYDEYALEHYKTFTPAMQEKLKRYAKSGGRILVSGSYMASDMQGSNEKAFLRDILHVAYNGCESNISQDRIDGMGTSFNIYKSLNEYHYASTRSDILHAVAPAYCALTYESGTSACVAYNGTDFKTISLGFPFECITSAKKRNTIMRGLMTFLLE